MKGSRKKCRHEKSHLRHEKKVFSIQNVVRPRAANSHLIK